jgi:uncharacterized membrane protein (UPF0127 family)
VLASHRYLNPKMKAKIAKGIDKIMGLMFKPRNTEPLLFDFGKPVRYAIHSFFVFFPIHVCLLDKDNTILKDFIMKPFEFVIPNNYYYKILEVPT